MSNYSWIPGRFPWDNQRVTGCFYHIVCLHYFCFSILSMSSMFMLVNAWLPFMIAFSDCKNKGPKSIRHVIRKKRKSCMYPALFFLCLNNAAASSYTLILFLPLLQSEKCVYGRNESSQKKKSDSAGGDSKVWKRKNRISGPLSMRLTSINMNRVGQQRETEICCSSAGACSSTASSHPPTPTFVTHQIPPQQRTPAPEPPEDKLLHVYSLNPHSSAMFYHCRRLHSRICSRRHHSQGNVSILNICKEADT